MSRTEKDYYEVLGVSPSASHDEIKKSFHKLARQHHPDPYDDKSNADEAYFKEITKAYATLGNPDKRSVYDKNRASDVATTPQAQKAQAARTQREQERTQAQAKAVGDEFRRTPKPSKSKPPPTQQERSTRTAPKTSPPPKSPPTSVPQHSAPPPRARQSAPNRRPPRPQQQPELPTIRLPNPAHMPALQSSPANTATTNRLAKLLLPVLGIGASLIVLLTLVLRLHGASPNFVESILGFACVVGFWVSVAKTLKAIVALFRR